MGFYQLEYSTIRNHHLGKARLSGLLKKRSTNNSGGLPFALPRKQILLRYTSFTCMYYYLFKPIVYLLFVLLLLQQVGMLLLLRTSVGVVVVYLISVLSLLFHGWEEPHLSTVRTPTL